MTQRNFKMTSLTLMHVQACRGTMIVIVGYLGITRAQSLDC